MSTRNIVQVTEKELRQKLIEGGMSERDADMHLLVGKTLGSHSMTPKPYTTTYEIIWEKKDEELGRSPAQ